MTALASVNATSANSLDICEAPYMGVSEKVLACPGGRIEIVSAEYGRPGDDRDTCCSNAKKCLVKPGDQCTADATEWVNTKCNGESECTLSGNMNAILADPCRFRQKFLNVQYDCINNSGESCVDVMSAASEYYSTLQVATMGDKTHHGRFTGDFTGEGGLKYNKRINLFKSNMLKWGGRLASNGCDCGTDNAAAIQAYTSQVNTSANPTVNYLNVIDIFSRMSSLLTCEEKTERMVAGVTRKMKHAKQILYGHSPNGNVIKNRHQNWLSFMN